MNLLDLVKNIETVEHYLRRPCVSYDEYLSELSVLVGKLQEVISETKLRDLINKKLQIELSNFEESQFIQVACELTVMNEFLGRDGFLFEYEKKVTPPKDVDFSISVDSINYNIEVKCPSFKEINNNDGEVKLHFPSRASSLEEKRKLIQPIRCILEENGKSLSEVKSLDNTMKDFLKSTQSKVSKSPLIDVNILVIGCDDEVNMHEWREYLVGYNGFFTSHSFIAHSDFDRVDYVLLTNMYNRHHKYYEQTRIDRHWHLSSCFNLLYPNKFSLRNQNVITSIDLKKMNSLFPNHNIEFEKYLSDETDVPDGESHEMKTSALGIAWFSDKFKKDGIHYFKPIKGAFNK